MGSERECSAEVHRAESRVRVAGRPRSFARGYAGRILQRIEESPGIQQRVPHHDRRCVNVSRKRGKLAVWTNNRTVV